MIKAEYIVGFTDGEGCFYVQIRRDHRIVLRYFITQRYDNKEILEQIRDFFDVGYVHLKKQLSYPKCFGNDKAIRSALRARL